MKYNKFYVRFFTFVSIILFLGADSIAKYPDVDGFKVKVLPSLGSLEISTGKIKLSGQLVFPELLNNSYGSTNWQHSSRTSGSKVLAGIKGELITDEYTNNRLKLIREFWVSTDESEVAVRQRVTNVGKENVRLKTLVPLSLNGNGSLAFKDEPDAANWNILVQKRLKNGKPASIVPGSSEVVEADPFCVITSNSEGTPDLLIGFLSQKGHLSRLMLQFDSLTTGAVFNSLIAECEFDGVIVPPGGDRTSQWVYIKHGFDTNKLIIDYADRVGVYYGVKPPANHAPTVFCTWYFHGRDYNEKYFLEDIQALQENRMPFDVFLIDACWAGGTWGYWEPNEAFPNGMKYVTNVMQENGYRPGIWTAPYLVGIDSRLANEHPEWLLKDEKGNPFIFGYAVKSYVIDPTYPGVIEHLEEVFRRLANDYGFSYFKFDFMRSVFIYENAKFYDAHKTRLEAYEMGLEAIRKGAGPDSYISVCGGHFGGSLGIANSQRSGSDVVSMWEPNQIDCFRQNILRTWMSRLWHVDPDALMIRKRDEPYHDPQKRHAKLALGKLTDAEALTFTLNQYIGGGMVCFSEFIPELQPERREFYKHVIPSINTPSKPLDIFNTVIPSMMLTNVIPLCESLEPWNTIAITNWNESTQKYEVVLSDDVVSSINSDKFIVSEFMSGEVLGIYSKNNVINLGSVKAHESRIVRIAPWNGRTPVLAGTDLHFSGGGVEIEEWNLSGSSVEGKVLTEWNYPVKVSVAFPANNNKGFILKSMVVEPGKKLFKISSN